MDFINGNSKDNKARKSPLESLKDKMISIKEPNDEPVVDNNMTIGFMVEESENNKENKIEVDTEDSVADKDEQEKSLLQKLERYTTDESGNNVAFDQKPLYELQSVADIIKSDGEAFLSSLSKIYDITIDDLGKEQPQNETQIENEPLPNNSEAGKTEAFKQMVADSVKMQAETQPEPENNFTLPDISDIDSVQMQEPETVYAPLKSDTATIRFTPVTNEKGDTQRVSVSSITRPINISLGVDTNESETAPQTNLELSEFEAFQPDNEVQNSDDFKRIARILAIKKRTAFLSATFSFISLFALLIFFIPPLYDLFISNAKLGMIITGSFWAVGFLANLDIFKSITKIKGHLKSADLLLVLPTLSTASLLVLSVLQNTSIFHIVVASAVSLFIRALSKFFLASAKLSNLKIAALAKNKKALSLISEPSTTYAMAKNTIEGDVLVAAPRKVEFISNFMKYSEFSIALSGKVRLIFIIVSLLSAICALAAGIYYNGFFHALYCLCSLVSLAAIPTLFLVDTLPVFSAAKRLNRKGCMIAGKSAAEKIELANAVTIPISDIFPAGSIVLNDMKVLTNNNIDRTLINAAALCDAMESPLTYIFKNIANSANGYPSPSLDTLKYEERLGISGWVDDELLFIGNRTLLEAHGIAVPSVEVDRRILRSGYFPVYVAQKDTACALLIVKYSADNMVVSALRRTTALGVTLLISNCDPNVNEEMIADYFGLYPDMLKVMSNAGVHILKTATAPIQSYSAPAVFSGSAINFLSIINCASRMKKSNFRLTIIYILACVLGIVYFAYASFAGGANAMPQLSSVLLYQIATLAVSLIIYLFSKP